MATSSSTLLIFSSLIIFSFLMSTYGNPHNFDHPFQSQAEEGVLSVPRRNAAEVSNSVMILAENRTRRKDPSDDFKIYTGGWNISSHNYWASVTSTAAPMLIVAVAWFVLFGLCLFWICCCHCCCAREPYGYSKVAYALSLFILILFTIASIIGCVILYTGQGEFHVKTSNTLSYILNQAEVTFENLENVSYYLAASKGISVDSTILPSDVLTNIDSLQKKIHTSVFTLATKTHEKSKDMHRLLDTVELILIIVAAVMLLLTFIGFLCSVLGLRCLVYILVIIGWILVTGTFLLCGVFFILNNVVTDSCVAMDEWVQHPAAHTALDEVLPCIDNTTAQETLLRSKDVTYRIVNGVNVFINNVSNQDLPPNIGMPLNFNQSGPKVPALCNPFNSDYSNRQCASGEVELSNATMVWKNYVCEVSASGECRTIGRITPDRYTRFESAVNISYGLYQYAPFLVGLQDCTFVRQTFTDVTEDYCPGLIMFSEWVYVGILTVSIAVMLSLVFWVIYGRERRHRVYTKRFNHPFERSSVPWQENNVQ